MPIDQERGGSLRWGKGQQDGRRKGGESPQGREKGVLANRRPRKPTHPPTKNPVPIYRFMPFGGVKALLKDARDVPLPPAGQGDR